MTNQLYIYNHTQSIARARKIKWGRVLMCVQYVHITRLIKRCFIPALVVAQIAPAARGKINTQHVSKHASDDLAAGPAGRM